MLLNLISFSWPSILFVWLHPIETGYLVFIHVVQMLHYIFVPLSLSLSVDPNSLINVYVNSIKPLIKLKHFYRTNGCWFLQFNIIHSLFIGADKIRIEINVKLGVSSNLLYSLVLQTYLNVSKFMQCNFNSFNLLLHLNNKLWLFAWLNFLATL